MGMDPKSNVKSCPISPQAKNKSSDCWVFVNVGEPKEAKNEEVRRMVRVKAARANRRRQRGRQRGRQRERQLKILAREGEESGKAKASAVAVMKGYPNTTAWRYHGTPHLPSDKQVLSDELETIRLAELASEANLGLLYVGGTSVIEPGRRRHAGDEHDLDSCSLKASNVPNPITLAGGMVDPFDTFPIGGSAQYKNRLLNHCK